MFKWLENSLNSYLSTISEGELEAMTFVGFLMLVYLLLCVFFVDK